MMRRKAILILQLIRVRRSAILILPVLVVLWVVGWILVSTPAKKEKQVPRDPEHKLQLRQET